MNLSIKPIFLQENEKDIFNSLQNQGIDTSIFEYYFIDLFNKMYNNEVGYYIFEQDNQIYKIIILPKTIDEKSPTAQKEFVDYLLHYYRVNNKYKFDKIKQIPNSLLSLAFETNHQNKKNSHNPIEEFEYYKYASILESIETFFKRHKNYKKVQVDYKSQDVKYKLNLFKNIKELDKTKIHQTQSLDVLYSQIATITYDALKLFTKRRVDIIKDEKYKKELIQKAKKAISFIAKKYPIDKNYKFSLSKLNNAKTTKVYSKKSDTKLLLVDIKSLFGFEQMYQDTNLYVNNRYDLTTTSLFINPSIFYEWYVYDILKDFADNNNYRILFDKDKGNKTTTQYNLVSPVQGEDKKRSSNPDYIIIDEKKGIKIVLDAKWKNIPSLSKIDSADFLKLKYDASLLENELYKTISYLIYPLYLSYEDKISISSDSIKYFDFGILQIDMDFNKKENSIDFKYDFNRIEEQIKKENDEENIKKSSETLTSEIGIHRSELIVQLLNSDNFEDKEKIFGELDNLFLESASKLNEEIEEKISPEIQKILKKYKDVLEEHSIRFLKSSSSIYNYYKKKKYEHFDYSMPASGLWKLVELELNTSFVWYVRIKKNVCDENSKVISLLQNDESFKIGRVELNKFEKNSDHLQSLMLGEIKFLSGNNGVQKLINNKFISKELFDFLKQIINIRNEHAHIKAMSLEKFDELYNLLFNNGNIIKTNLYKLLLFKQFTCS